MADLFIGLMSGTSLDGVDAVLVSFDASDRPTLHSAVAEPFDPALRALLHDLQRPGDDELNRSALAANRLADFQAAIVDRVRALAGVEAAAVRAVGSHGQTVRHRPDLGYTIQLDAPARLAEACGITVVSDFRSRDVAAGGHGAPLVPAFHARLFAAAGRHRVVVNLGGMSNVTDLPADPAHPVRGWDCGPGNVLLDGWIARHRGQRFDANGAWAASGADHADLLARLLDDPWLALGPPKSTGREQFDLAWLDARLTGFESLAAVDVQATLSSLTAAVVVESIARYAGRPDDLIVCGGGAYNTDLLERIGKRLAARGLSTRVALSAERGVAPEHVEALAFAWLAMRCLANEPGNLPAVTGARGPRVLGAIHPR